MFAQCVSRTFVAFVLVIALAVLPAAGVLAAPTAPSGAAVGWVGAVHQWVAEWTDHLLDLLRIQPHGDGDSGDTTVVAAPVPTDDGLTRIVADDSGALDPDG